MIFTFGQQCCDAYYYLYAGELCATEGTCWKPIRPIGAIFYASIPYLTGNSPELLVLLNFILIFLSVALAYRVLGIMNPVLTKYKIYIPIRIGMLLLIHSVFMFGDARTSLSDVPAAGLVLIGIWLFILGLYRKNHIMTGLSGLSLGTSVIIRSFYYYPLILFGLVFLTFNLKQKKLRQSFVLIWFILAAIPVFMQYSATHSNTGKWSLLEPGLAGYWKGYHLNSSDFGYDTVLPGTPQKFPANDCFKEPDGIKGGLLRGDLFGVGCLLLKRNQFYFGSYSSRTFISSPQDRNFSGWFIFLYLAAIILLVMTLRKSNISWVFYSPLAFFAGVWFLGIMVIPETRFLMSLFVFVWVFAISGLSYYLIEIFRYLWKAWKKESQLSLPF